MVYKNSITLIGDIIDSNHVKVKRDSGVEDIVQVENLDYEYGCVALINASLETDKKERKEYVVRTRNNKAVYSDDDLIHVNRVEIQGYITYISEPRQTPESKLQIIEIKIAVNEPKEMYYDCILYSGLTTFKVGQFVNCKGRLLSRTYKKHHAEHVDIGGYTEIDEWDEDVMVNEIAISKLEDAE